MFSARAVGFGPMVVEVLGIRFATAERFGPPQLLPWTGDHLGRFGDACPQPPGEVFMASDMTQSEDCLYLNVWTPSRDGSRPVMVWIHGGGYRQGSGDHFLSRGHVLAERGDVVVVTCDYRLGALGFAGGTNCGLLDQQAALRWVRTNIADFGGDPANVTLFGESAGAGSVGMQLVMPRSAGRCRTRRPTTSWLRSCASRPRSAARWCSCRRWTARSRSTVRRTPTCRSSWDPTSTSGSCSGCGTSTASTSPRRRCGNGSATTPTPSFPPSPTPARRAASRWRRRSSGTRSRP